MQVGHESTCRGGHRHRARSRHRTGRSPKVESPSQDQQCTKTKPCNENRKGKGPREGAMGRTGKIEPPGGRACKEKPRGLNYKRMHVSWAPTVRTFRVVHHIIYIYIYTCVCVCVDCDLVNLTSINRDEIPVTNRSTRSAVLGAQPHPNAQEEHLVSRARAGWPSDFVFSSTCSNSKTRQMEV